MSDSKAIGKSADVRLATTIGPKDLSQFRTNERLMGTLRLSAGDIQSGRYRIQLYRFMANQIPVISACVGTWVRLAAAPGAFRVVDSKGETRNRLAEARLEKLSDRIFANCSGNRVGLSSLMIELFTSLFRDGVCGGFLTLTRDGSGVDQFVPIDALALCGEQGETGLKLYLETDGGRVNLDRADFFHMTLSDSLSDPLGRSILQPIPFVAGIEQQLVRDMYRSHHNSGYSRIHVKVTPPARLAGESDSAYTERINRYFDATVDMIKSCDVDENPVTWDNVTIEYIGPSETRSVTNSWFVNHRATIEDICAGTNLAPFLLGYSYGATTTWSGFKFDLVMRQVRSVQAQAANLLERIANIDLALGGLDVKCRFLFDNSLAYQASEQTAVESRRVENLLKLHQAGLIDDAVAKERAEHLI